MDVNWKDVAQLLAESIRLTRESMALEIVLPAVPGWSWYDAILRYEEAVKLEATKPKSNLVTHARRELEIVGEEPETIEGYLKVIQAFADMGHSGGSASIAVPVLNQLLQHKNLRPLTNDNDEWFFHEAAQYGTTTDLWQNKRNSEAISLDGGKTYYLMSECRTTIFGRRKKKMRVSDVVPEIPLS